MAISHYLILFLGISLTSSASLPDADGHTSTSIKPQGLPVAISCRDGEGGVGTCASFGLCIAQGFSSDYVDDPANNCKLSEFKVGVCCPNLRKKRQTEVDIQEEVDELEGDKTPDYSQLGEPSLCGYSSKQLARVLKAQQAAVRDYPWMVALLTKEGYRHFCGGALITRNVVLTAAHCVPKVLPEKIIARLGEYDFTKATDSKAVDAEVSRIVSHEDYDISNYENDIALLFLKKPATYDSYVQPVCLPVKDYITNDFKNTTAVVAGWGTVDYGGPMSDVLLEVPVPIWEQESCVKSFTQTVFDSALCAAGYEGHKDACQGDSGGPLVTQRDDGRWMTIGIVSWGVGCGTKGKPGVYTRVNHYIDWIAAKINEK